VIGQNYRENEILAAHAAKPARKILGTENHGELSTWLALRDKPALCWPVPVERRRLHRRIAPMPGVIAGSGPARTTPRQSTGGV